MSKKVPCDGPGCVLCALFPTSYLIQMYNPETGNVHNFKLTASQLKWIRGEVSFMESASPIRT
jgi:hypothetical protein